MRCFTITTLLLLISLSGFGQEVKINSDTLKKDAVNVFMDCGFCDMNYFRKQITFVNYVRDRKEAQVHILSAFQQTGAGGGACSFFFIGQKNFAGINDTLIYSYKADATEDERREGQIRILKMGLIRYVSKTPYADKISIHMVSPPTDENVRDKWKSWVINIDGGGYFSGEQLRKSVSAWGSIGATKITKDWKIEFHLDNNYNQSNFQIDDTTEIVSISQSRNFNHLFGRSINDHWSAGFFADANSSDYSNIKLGAGIAPAIEYDLFPYSQATRKQLRILYSIGYSYTYYNDTTIFNKIQEGFGKERLAIAFEIKQKWGSVAAYMAGSNLLHDLSFNNFYFHPEINIRITKGLSVRLGGNVSIIHDQVALPKAGATLEEILLQQRQLATQYGYWANVGLTYTFGSIYNNVVNPRFH